MKVLAIVFTVCFAAIGVATSLLPVVSILVSATPFPLDLAWAGCVLSGIGVFSTVGVTAMMWAAIKDMS
jgi:hypothetical protein